MKAEAATVNNTRALGLKSGIGLVIANMIGAGVFLSTGFMAQEMSAGLILFAWAVGGVLAMTGAVAYAEVARLVPRSGGEYRYLSTLIHPALGFTAGWASLVVGFAAPVAIDALAAGAFARATGVTLDPRLFGTAVVIALTAVHCLTLSSSARTQNILVAIKVVLLLGFVTAGLVKGTLAWPTWAPTHPTETPVAAFASNLFFVAFAYSGWNAATYAAEEFEHPTRQVPMAMVTGAALVTVVYLLVNAIFVANLSPAQGTVVFHYDSFASGGEHFDQVTLGQTLMAALMGPAAAKIMSAVMVVLFCSAISAMTLVGPRVASAMAQDQFLPAIFAAKPGRPPMLALLFQATLAIALLWIQDLRSALASVGALLTLFAALTMSGLVFRAVRPGALQSPSKVSVACALIYMVSSACMLAFGIRSNPTVLVWVGVLFAVGLFGWWRSKQATR